MRADDYATGMKVADEIRLLVSGLDEDDPRRDDMEMLLESVTNAAIHTAMLAHARKFIKMLKDDEPPENEEMLRLMPTGFWSVGEYRRDAEGLLSYHEEHSGWQEPHDSEHRWILLPRVKIFRIERTTVEPQ